MGTGMLTCLWYPRLPDDHHELCQRNVVQNTPIRKAQPDAWVL